MAFARGSKYRVRSPGVIARGTNAPGGARREAGTVHTLAGTGWRYCLNKGIGSYLSKRRLSEDKVIAAHPPLSAWMSSIGFALKSLSSRTCARVDRSPPLFDRLKKSSYDHRCAQRTRTNLSLPWIVVSLADDREEERRKLEGESTWSDSTWRRDEKLVRWYEQRTRTLLERWRDEARCRTRDTTNYPACQV